MAIIRGPQKTAVSGVRVFWGTSSEKALRGRNAAPGLNGHRCMQRQPERLEGRLRDVVAVPSTNHVDMDRRPEMNRERLPELLEDLGLQRADAPAQRHVVREEWTLPQVDDDPPKRFVQRCVSRREAGDPGPVSQRLGQRLAEHDAYVLNQVMGVDVKVAGAL